MLGMFSGGVGKVELTVSRQICFRYRCLASRPRSRLRTWPGDG